MKRSIQFLFCILVVYPFGAVAEQPKPMPGMGMMSRMMSMSGEQLDAHLKSKQAHMLMMHGLINQILTESDPKKKQELKNQHIEVMKAHHKKMQAKHAKKMSQHHK